MLVLADKDFKAAIRNMFKDLKETTVKELKKGFMTIADQKQDVNKEIEIIKKNQMEILEWKSTIIEIKNVLKWFTVYLSWEKKESVNVKIDLKRCFL